MLWRTQSIARLEMGVSYMYMEVVSVVVCGFVYLTCMGMGSCATFAWYTINITGLFVYVSKITKIQS